MAGTVQQEEYNIQYRAVQLDDCEELIDLFIEYLNDLPMLSAIQKTGDMLSREVFRDWVYQMIQEGSELTPVAYDTKENNKIVGVFFSYGCHEGKPSSSDYEKHMGNENKDLTAMSVAIRAEHSKHYDVYKSFGVDKHARLGKVSVDKAYRRRGIGRKLAAKALELAKDQGYEVASMITSNQYASKLALSLGFVDMHQMSFKKVEGWEKIFPEELIRIHSPMHFTAMRITNK